MLRKRLACVLCALVASCFVCRLCAGIGAAASRSLTFTDRAVQSSAAFGLVKDFCARGYTVLLAHFGARPEVVADWDDGLLIRESSGFDVNPLAVAAAGLVGLDDLTASVRALRDECIPAKKAVAAIVASSANVSSRAGSQPSGGIRMITHTVAKGESLSVIAQKYSVSVDTIMWSNSLSNPNKLKIGQTLKFPSISGVVHVVSRGESIWTIAKKYGISRDEIVRANQLDEPDKLQLKQALVIPGAKPLPVRSAPIAIASRGAASSRSSSQGALAWPLSGRISSYFGLRWGRMHNGIDLAVPIGTPVKAAADGCVIFAASMSGYGRLVILDHGAGVHSYYGHNSSFAVKVGDTVAAGDRIALSGNSGVSTGPHLHFEIRVNGRAVNPLDYLK